MSIVTIEFLQLFVNNLRLTSSPPPTELNCAQETVWHSEQFLANNWLSGYNFHGRASANHQNKQTLHINVCRSERLV